MKTTRRLSFFLALLIILSFCIPASLAVIADEEVADNPGIISGNAAAAYAIDENRFLYSYRLDERVAPAATTKLVTCMVVSDLLSQKKLSADEVTVTVTDEAVALAGNVLDARVPVMGFKGDESYSAKDLLSATLVSGANDAAAALAVHFGVAFLNGDINTFIAQMNKKVEDLGLKNTHFENATGHNHPNQYSTPREVALIAAAFYGYNDLVTLSNVEYFTFNNKATVYTKNYLKTSKNVSGYKNSNAIGIIAGQLDVNGNYCLIAATEKEGKAYIFVVMCASGMVVNRDPETGKTDYYFEIGNNAYDDMNKLINWTRDAFELVSVAAKDTIIDELHVDLGNTSDHVMVVPAETVESLILKSSKKNIKAVLTYDETIVYKKDFNGERYDTVRAPIEKGQRVGVITYTCDDIVLAQVDAVVKDGVSLDTVKNFFSEVEGFLFGPVMKTIFTVILVIIGLYIVAAIVAFAMKVNKKSKKNKKQKEKPKKVSKRDDKTDTREML